MRTRIILSVVASMLLSAGCQSRSGTAMAEPTVKLSTSSDGGGGFVMVPPTWISVGVTDWVIAPIALSESAAKGYSLGKLGSDGYRPQLPQAEGFTDVGSGPWINFTIFNRNSGKSVLALDRRAIVWHVTKSDLESDSLLVLASDTDTNRDGKLNDLDATAVYQLQLTDTKLTRLTPEKTTVVSAAPDPVVAGKPRRNQVLFEKTVEPDPKRMNGLLVTVRTDSNGDGKFEKDEPTQVVRIDPSLKNPPQSVMDASQWQKAMEIWAKG